MRVFIGIIGLNCCFAFCSAQAAQEALGKPLDTQRLAQQSTGQRIMHVSVDNQYTPEMLSERKIRKYRRPAAFFPVAKEKFKTFKKRKSFILDTN